MKKQDYHHFLAMDAFRRLCKKIKQEPPPIWENCQVRNSFLIGFHEGIKAAERAAKRLAKTKRQS